MIVTKSTLSAIAIALGLLVAPGASHAFPTAPPGAIAGDLAGVAADLARSYGRGHRLRGHGLRRHGFRGRFGSYRRHNGYGHRFIGSRHGQYGGGYYPRYQYRGGYDVYRHPFSAYRRR